MGLMQIEPDPDQLPLKAIDEINKAERKWLELADVPTNVEEAAFTAYEDVCETYLVCLHIKCLRYSPDYRLCVDHRNGERGIRR